jgi:hypothetical protein
MKVAARDRDVMPKRRVKCSAAIAGSEKRKRKQERERENEIGCAEGARR